MTQASGRRRASAVAAALFAAATVAALVAGPLPFDEPLFYVLVPLAIAGNLISARYEGATVVSPEFGCSMMAVAFLGPLGGRYERVARPELARRLLEEVERRG